MGRFAGMDPWGGSEQDPSSLHRYLFGSGDPGNKTDPSGMFGLTTSFTVMSMIVTIAAIPSIGCARLQRPKDVSVAWMDGLLVGLPATVAETIKTTALSTMRAGIGHFGVTVREDRRGHDHVDFADRGARGSRGVRPGGTLLGWVLEPHRAEVYYNPIRDVVRSLLPPSEQNGQSFGEALGNALGFVAVHEWGHLVIDKQEGYHDPFDTSAYNSQAVDSGSGTGTLALTWGMGHWPKDIDARIRIGLSQ